MADSLHEAFENRAAQAGRRLSARRHAIRRLADSEPSNRRAHTQARLLEAGTALLAEQGVGGTSVGDICTRAGFTRGAFYSNFTDMDHFVGTVAEHQWATIIEFVDEAIAQAVEERKADHSDETPAAGASDDELSQELSALASRILGALPVSRQFHLLQSEFSTYVARNPDRAPSLRAGYESFRDRMAGFLASGLASIGRETTLSVADTTDLILATAERSMRNALSMGEEDLTGLLDRTLPNLLARLSRPVPQD